MSTHSCTVHATILVLAVNSARFQILRCSLHGLFFCALGSERENPVWITHYSQIHKYYPWFNSLSCSYGSKCTLNPLTHTLSLSYSTGVECSIPKQLDNGTVCFNGIEYNKKVEYKCDEGYSLVGPSIRFCQSNGTWSEEEPSCKCKNAAVVITPKVQEKGSMQYR